MAATVNLGLHSWHDFVTTASRRLNEPPCKGAEDASTRGEHTSDVKSGSDSLADAIKLARDGWQDGAREITKALDRLPPGQDVLPDWTMDVAGSSLCVPAFISGEPECMWRQEEHRRTAHRLALIVAESYGASTTVQEAQQYAKAVAAITRAIEAAGIDVAVYSVGHRKQKHGNATELNAVSVREYGEPLDLSKVAFAFHPSFLRRLSWAWREITPAAVRWARDGYGRTEPIGAAELAEILPDAGNCTILPRLHDLSARSTHLLRDTPESLTGLINHLRATVDAAIKELT